MIKECAWVRINELFVEERLFARDCNETSLIDGGTRRWSLTRHDQYILIYLSIKFVSLLSLTNNHQQTTHFRYFPVAEGISKQFEVGLVPTR